MRASEEQFAGSPCTVSLVQWRRAGVDLCGVQRGEPCQAQRMFNMIFGSFRRPRRDARM